MSNPDKHKPLSAEELFKLLENTSNKESDFNEMDDFEKDALEGFSSHSNAQKAKALTDELNLAISKKVTSTSSVTKNKVIWFSAAASIVLVIMLSVFFFTQSKEDSATNIALNELKENEELKVTQTELPNPPETISENTVTSKDVQSPTNKEIETIKLTDAVGVSEKMEGESLSGAMSPVETTMPAAEYRSENKPIALAEKVAKDESKNRSDDNDLKQQEGIASDNIETKKKEKNSLEQEQINYELQAKQNVAKTASNEAARSTKEEGNYYKADADKSVAAKKSFEKEKSASVSSGVKTIQTANSYDKSSAEPVGGNVASAPASSADNKTMSAYYTGSELAIRDYVLNYLKEKTTKVIVGKYKIMATVSINGTLKVNSLTQITREYCACEDSIKEALNTMTKWNPAQEAGKKVSSNVEFTLVFY